MGTTTTSSTVKLIGANDQISLGKQYAGRQVIFEEQEPGVWLVRTVTVIPDNEAWLHTPQAAAGPHLGPGVTTSPAQGFFHGNRSPESSLMEGRPRP